MHMDQRSKDLSPGSQCKRDCAESRQCSSHWCNLLFAVQEEPWWGFCHDILMMINLIKTLIIEIINKKIFTPTKTWAWPMCDHKAGHCCSDFSLGCSDDQPSSLATLRPSPGRPWHVQDDHDDYHKNVFKKCQRNKQRTCSNNFQWTCSNWAGKPSAPSAWREATWPRNISVVKWLE